MILIMLVPIVALITLTAIALAEAVRIRQTSHAAKIAIEDFLDIDTLVTAFQVSFRYTGYH